MNESIRPVTLDDVVGLDRYEQDRDEIRRRVIALKKNRRVNIGDCVTFIFENHETVFFQVQEMLRAEAITDLDAIREELEVYNAMLPAAGELSSTMMIEITDAEQIEARLRQLIGIDECVSLEIGEHRVAAEFEPGRSREDRLSAVQYVRLRCPEEVAVAFRDEARPAFLRIDHKNYRHSTPIEGEIRRSLARDLA